MRVSASAQSLATLMATAWHAEQGHNVVNYRTHELCPHESTDTIKALEGVAATVSANAVLQPPAFEYARGQPVYYGSTLALRAHHGGYLALDSKGRANTASRHRTPPVLLVIWNLANLGDKAIVRYGDRVWLQSSRYEVLGTSPLTQDYAVAWGELLGACSEAASRYELYNSPDWAAFAEAAKKERAVAADTAATLARKPTTPLASNCRPREVVGRLAAVRCAGRAFASAKHLGRWVLVNANEPHATLGKPVYHLDDVAFQQEWLFLSSRRAGSAELRTSAVDTSQLVQDIRSVLPMNKDALRFASSDRVRLEKDLTWTLHIVTIPTTSADEERRLQCAIQARRQLSRSERTASQSVTSMLRMRMDRQVSAQATTTAMLRHVFRHEYTESESDKLAAHGDWVVGNRTLLRKPANRGGNSLSSGTDDAPMSIDSVKRNRRRCVAILGVPGSDEHAERVKAKKLENLRAAYDHHAQRRVSHVTSLSSADHVMVKSMVRDARAASTIQRWTRNRLECCWRWKLAREDRRGIEAAAQASQNASLVDNMQRRPSVVAFGLPRGRTQGPSLVARRSSLRTAISENLTCDNESISRAPRPASAPALKRPMSALVDSKPRQHDAGGQFDHSSPSPSLVAQFGQLEDVALSLEDQEKLVALLRKERRSNGTQQPKTAAKWSDRSHRGNRAVVRRRPATAKT